MRPSSSNPKYHRRDAFEERRFNNDSNGERRDYKKFTTELQHIDKSMVQDDQKSFDIKAKNQYDRVIGLIEQNREQSRIEAFKSLQNLCKSLYKLSWDSKFTILLAQNLVKTYWSLRNELIKRTEANNREGLELISTSVSYFEQLFERNAKINLKNRHSLAFFHLIKANEQYHCQKYKESLDSCEKSLKLCGGSKLDIEMHKIKVYFLKANIYEAIKDTNSELSAIKNCLQLIHLSYRVISQTKEKESMNKLKENLNQRKKGLEAQLENSKPSQLNQTNSHKASLNKFRKRTFSLKKSQSLHQIKLDKINEKPTRGFTPDNSRYQLYLNKDKITTAHIQLSNKNLKKVTINEKKSVLDLRRDFPKNGKLKKKPLKLDQSSKHFQQKPSVYETINVFEEIQHLEPPTVNYQELMVARPKAKKEQLSENLPAQIENRQSQIRKVQTNVSQLEIKKKESQEYFTQKIEPITHTMNDQVLHQMQEEQKQQREAIENVVIKEHEENVLKQFLKKTFNSFDQFQFNLRGSQNQQHSNIQQNSQNGQLYFDQQNYKSLIQNSDVKPISYKELLNGFQQQKYNLKNVELKIGQEVKLCTSFGYLSNFDIKTHVYSLLQEDDQAFQRILVIKLKALLNEEELVFVTLQYKFQSEENDIQEIMIAALNKLGQSRFQQSQNTIDLIFHLLSNKIVPIKKTVGTVLTQKLSKDALKVAKSRKEIQRYRNYLKQHFTIYQLNTKTTKLLKTQIQKYTNSGDSETKKEKQLQFEKKVNFKDQQQLKEQPYDDYYIVLLIKKLTQDLKEDASIVSSLKRIKTQFRKNTIISYKSTMKSIDLGDFNLNVKDEQSKTLSVAIMPTNFRAKISNYFQNHFAEKKQQTPFEQFYYCMKFVLIKPFNTSQSKFIRQFYDKIEVLYLHRLKNRLNCKIKMTCLKPKQIFKVDSQLFFKFELEVIGLKTKMVKFIATSKDLKLFNLNTLKPATQRNMRNSKKFMKKVNLVQQQSQYAEFKQESLMNLLKKMAPNIFIKKDYIYNIVGFENEKTTFNYINKFKLQGKTVQNRHFMINHLKQINVLFQKSIKIKCECLKEFAILTIRKINYSQEFNMYFYVPKLQKTFSLSLKQDIIKYLSKAEAFKVFKTQDIKQDQMKHQLFRQFQQLKEKSQQRQLWNNFVNIFVFSNHFMEDRMQISLKIGKYEAFLKDCSFSQYFQLNRFIYYMEMSLSKKGLPISQEIENHKKALMNSFKRKSSSSKELIKQSNKILEKSAMKASAKVPKLSIRQSQKQQLNKSLSFQKIQFLQKFNQIYQTDADKYVLYITLSQIIEVKPKDEYQTQYAEPKKIAYSFYLSNLCALIKQCKTQLEILGLTVKQEDNEQIFSFALLQRTMTVIKYRIIKELRKQSEIGGDFIINLFQGEKTIENQYLFKNKLNQVFRCEEQSSFSLNSSKKLHNFQKNNFLIYKNVMQLKKNQLIAINYSQLNRSITFFLINNLELTSKHKGFNIDDIKMPFLSFLKRQELCLMSSRIYEYYKNILLIL